MTADTHVGMPALTLWQPYASAIPAGFKTVETRTGSVRKRMARLVGHDLAIHAAVKRPRPLTQIDGWTVGDDGPEGLGSFMVRGAGHDQDKLLLPLGCVVAVVRVAAVVRMVQDKGGVMAEPVDDGEQVLAIARRPWGPMLTLTTNDRSAYCWPINANVTDQLPWGDFQPGRTAIVLDNVRPLADPVEARGYQQVWRLPLAAERAVLRQIDRCSLCDGTACEENCGYAHAGPYSHRVCRRCGGSGKEQADA